MKAFRSFCRLLLLSALALPLSGLDLPPNRVLTLNGTSSFVDIPSSAGLQNATELTIGVWLNPSSQSGLFVGKTDGQSGQSQRSYQIAWQSSGTLVVDVFWEVVGGKPDFATLATPVPANRWTHVAVAFSSALGSLQVFTNGVLATADLTLAGRTLRQTSLPVTLGRIAGSANTYAKGSLDELRIWNRALSATEILAEFHCPSSGDPSLKGYWNFDDGTALDLTGNGNGSLQGGASIGLIAGEDVIHADCDQPRPATATAQVVNGFVVGATITDGGYGYTNTPLVTITGGGGSGATATSTMVNGVVTGITIVTAGTGYTGTPSLVIEPPPYPPEQAKGTATLVNGFVTGVTITEGGHGYGDTPPPVHLLGGGGTGAKAVATVVNGVVTGITVTDPGSGYTTLPRVLIAAPPGLPSLSIDVSQVRVVLRLLSGYTYQLQTTTEFAGWTNIGSPFLATEETMTQVFEVTGSTQTFRVVQVP